MDVFDASERYREEKRQLIILAGKDYGSGSSRDWAAKGPWMLVIFFYVHCKVKNIFSFPVPVRRKEVL